MVMVVVAQKMMVMMAAWRRPMAAPHRGGSLLVSFKVATMVFLMWMVVGLGDEMLNDEPWRHLGLKMNIE